MDNVNRDSVEIQRAVKATEYLNAARESLLRARTYRLRGWRDTAAAAQNTAASEVNAAREFRYAPTYRVMREIRGGYTVTRRETGPDGTLIYAPVVWNLTADESRDYVGDATYELMPYVASSFH